MWSFVVPAAWLALFATPEQLARAAAPANALLLGMFLLHYLVCGLGGAGRGSRGRDRGGGGGRRCRGST